MSDRYPGFTMTSQIQHWDPATARVISDRLAPPAPLTFFTSREAVTCAALVTQLLALESGNPVPVVAMIDSRLTSGETDGWHYADLPTDDVAWRRSLAHLDGDARLRCGRLFADSHPHDQAQIVDTVQRQRSRWPGLPAAHLWSLWTRYACTAFYSHPFAFDEIGFPGPAYPRGYKNIGIDRREPFEMADAAPHDPRSGEPR